RATPSPTWRTVPTSSSSALVLVPESCSLKIAETSSGLTSAIIMSLCYFRYILIFLLVEILREFQFQLIQLTAERLIDLSVTHCQHKASYQVFIQPFSELHFLFSGDFLDHLNKRLSQLGINRESSNHFRLLNAFVGIVLLMKFFGNIQ